MTEYRWQVQRKEFGLWVHHQGADPVGVEVSDLPADQVVERIARRLRPFGEWRLVAWESPRVDLPPVAGGVYRTCPDCGDSVLRARNVNGDWRDVDISPSDGGELALVGDPRGVRTVMRVVDPAPAGEEPAWGVLAINWQGPRHRLHFCP